MSACRFLLPLFVSFVLLIGCNGNNDNDTDVNTTDDDDNDDDDNDDDDNNDNDNDDNNDNNDDTSPPTNYWDGLTPQGLPVGEILGIATQMYDGPDPNEDRTFEIERLVEAQIHRVRASIDWPDVEPEQDQFTFEYNDPFVALLTDAGLQFDGRLCYGVDWAAPDDNDSAILPEDFGDYAYHVAEHYCGVIDSHEVWNEENSEVFWQPEPDPAAFGAMIKAAYIGVHDACPTAKLVWGGLTPFQISTMLKGPYYFIEQVYEAHPDIADYFDVMAIHPYTFLQQPSPEWPFYLGNWEFFPSLPGQIRLARERLAKIGAAGKPIWATEWGWPSLIIGDDAQAKYYARGALLAIVEGVEALDWYTMYDREPGSSTLPTEDYFGFFTWPGAEEGPQQKPVYLAAQTLSVELHEMRYAGDLSAAMGLPDGVYGLAFVSQLSGVWDFVGWDSRWMQGTEISLLAPPNATRYRLMGQSGIVFAEGPITGPIEFSISNEVFYVRFWP